MDVLREYQHRFYEVFEFIASCNNASNDMFHELDVFPGEDGTGFIPRRLNEVAE